MIKIKNIIAIIVFAVLIVACENDNLRVNPFADVDHKALAVSENDSIVRFLTTHYYDEAKDSLKLITNNELAMIDDTERLKIIDTTRNNINFKMYVFVTEEGIPELRDKNNPNSERKSNPTKVDSIFVNRKGIQLINNDLDTAPFDESNETWWSLASTFGLPEYAPNPILAWVIGFPYLKSGQNITNNGPLTYANTGKGYFFIPSGLAYTSINFQFGQNPNALFDKTIVFKVELLDIVEDTDHDQDGTPTINEDANNDGDVTNDFSDSSTNLPDYLNPNVK